MQACLEYRFKRMRFPPRTVNWHKTFPRTVNWHKTENCKLSDMNFSCDNLFSLYICKQLLSTIEFIYILQILHNSFFVMLASTKMSSYIFLTKVDVSYSLLSAIVSLHVKVEGINDSISRKLYCILNMHPTCMNFQ